MRDVPWHKDAVIYQLHVRTFADGNGDGIGDFRGLIGRLDYLQDLGVSCLWLLPFYESPLRDDGYDISHYERIHPSYGTMADVEAFLDEAHRRGLRVITELVINHTSDQHPWFQAARQAPAGSPKRDFYVWSDTPDRYAQARVIFSDAESSNWTWDPVAGAYFWHRFFHHQPDLNFDNPHVRQAVLKVMRFWFDKGVDGLRLDAIAHLYEREGTSCDNLPETHALLKWLRADMDGRYADRILLAEANQPPAVLREYFGAGDECHMAFHFPLVARLFAAFADGVAAPIIDAVQRNADIPAACQWALFLRNHDDMSLSALGPDDNARLLAIFAPEERMQLHGGIRRRLAPLLHHDQRRLELAHALLLSLPGTPILYYGDEIGMDDSLDLPDRDGLRTPMQWDDSAQGGFTTSGTPGSALNAGAEAPAHTTYMGDEARAHTGHTGAEAPAYTVHAEAEALASTARAAVDGRAHTTYMARRVNVAAQWDDPSSLLNRVATMLRVRRAHHAFGRGSITFLATGSPSVLGFVRQCSGDTILVIANLTPSPQRAVTALTSTVRITSIAGSGRQPESLMASGPIEMHLAPYEWVWWTIADD